MSELRHVPMSLLRLRADCQARVDVSAEHVRDLFDALDAGLVFPPIDVVEIVSGAEMGVFVVIDGFHRHAAHLSFGSTMASVNVVAKGTIEDARELALGANSEPRAMRRTNADKRNAVRLALEHPRAADWSNIRVADICRVSHEMVRQARARTEAADPVKVHAPIASEPAASAEAPPAPTVGTPPAIEPKPGTESHAANQRAFDRALRDFEIRTGGFVAWKWYPTEEAAKAAKASM